MLNISELNDDQRRVVDTTEGYLLVLAGAGTGKTHALTHRYLELVKEVKPKHILAITFTRKAANEMKERIRNAIGDYDGGFICTFHGFCAKMLRDDGNEINISREFKIHDEEQTNKDIQLAINRTGHTAKDIKIEDAKKIILLYKSKIFRKEYIECKTANSLDSLNRYIEKYNNDKICPWVKQMFWQYMKIQNESNSLDYSDLINLGLVLLERVDSVREKWQTQLEYIMVDEFQDVNENQYRLVSILSEKHKNLMVVGDPNQTIYSFRGSKIEFILNFSQEHGNCPVVRMAHNYRSTQPILDAANELIKYNTLHSNLELYSDELMGRKPLYYHAKDEEKEKTWIAGTIQGLVSSVDEEGRKKKPYRYSDIAILCKDNNTCRAMDIFMRDHFIPATIVSNMKFYELEIIRIAISYLALVYDTDNDKAFDLTINCPSRQIGRESKKVIAEYAKKNNCSLFEALSNVEIKAKRKAKHYIDTISYYHKQYQDMSLIDLTNELLNDVKLDMTTRKGITTADINHLKVLKNIIYDYEHSAGEPVTLDQLLDYFKLHMDDEEVGNRLRISTIHSAKGLEFPVVFIPNLIQGVFPNSSAGELDKVEEERRVFYVALTRAKYRLYLSDSNGPVSSRDSSIPSKFIYELGDTITYEEPLPRELRREPRKPDRVITPAEILPVGTRVHHNKLGDGTIREVGCGEYTIKFDNYDVLKKRCYGSVTSLGYSVGWPEGTRVNLRLMSDGDMKIMSGIIKEVVDDGYMIKSDNADRIVHLTYDEAMDQKVMIPIAKPQPEEPDLVEYPMDYISPLLMNREPSSAVMRMIRSGASMDDVEYAQTAEAYPF